MKNMRLSLLLTAALLLGGGLQSCDSSNQSTTSAKTETASAPSSSPEGSPGSTPTTPQIDEAKAARWTDISKLLAGMKVGEDSEFSEVQKRPTWVSHHSFLEDAFGKLEDQQLSKVRQWAATEIADLHRSTQPLFYPFSGPDILYANTFFPKAEEYVLIALEPVGPLPDFSQLSTEQQNLKLLEAKNSLFAILQYSFFRTNDMKVDLQKQGVLPVLLVFLARTNNRVLDVEYIGIDSSGTVQSTNEKAKGMVPGVKVTFTAADEDKPRTLYYFSTDLSDDGLKKTPQLAQFVDNLDQPNTYLKAASYLMHYDSTFKQIRELTLAKATNLLQDDSGMPVRVFDDNQWNLTFYGNYTAPRAPFTAEEYQTDLNQIYQKNAKIQRLNFGIGYNFGPNESNLMLAKVKR